MERDNFKERRNELEDFNIQWSKFRDPLRREDQLVLDEMFRALEIHKDACDLMPNRDRFATAVVSMLIEQRKTSIRLGRLVEDVERGMRRHGDGEDWLFADSR